MLNCRMTSMCAGNGCLPSTPPEALVIEHWMPFRTSRRGTRTVAPLASLCALYGAVCCFALFTPPSASLWRQGRLKGRLRTHRVKGEALCLPKVEPTCQHHADASKTISQSVCCPGSMTGRCYLRAASTREVGCCERM